jgi:hypothetical protein
LTIWIDADACPAAIRDIVLRASRRTGIPVVLVANKDIPSVRQVPGVTLIQVGMGADVADQHIADNMASEDLVITADLPLAAQVVENGGTALSHQGTEYTIENVRQQLSMRDFMESMRGAGLASGGPPPQSGKDRQRFANALDRLLTQRCGG